MEEEEAAFNEALRARTRELRERNRLEQQQVADLLGIELETYKKYETRTPLPRYLVPRFARIMRVSIAYFLTGYEEN